MIESPGTVTLPRPEPALLQIVEVFFFLQGGQNLRQVSLACSTTYQDVEEKH